ncbi:MAG: DUF421 domain-containing protein [Actinobacteria bacterium]|nr:DUF421 domain-containing protein [Actinomycetota bacterium]
MDDLWLTWTDAGLVILTALVAYAAMLSLSRIFGQRQFATATSYDLPFVLAIGAIIGRVILVRTSLGAALLGLVTLFTAHAITGWLHHHWVAFHRITQNRPRLVVAHGEFVDEQLERAHLSRAETFEAVRASGHASLAAVLAVVLERNGETSVIEQGEPIEPELWREVEGADRLLDRPPRS